MTGRERALGALQSEPADRLPVTCIATNTRIEANAVGGFTDF